MLEAAVGRPRERMPADEREARRQRRRGRHDAALRAAGVGDDGRRPDVGVEIGEHGDVLLHRRREDHDVGLGQHDEIVGRDVDRVQPHRRLEHVLVVDRDHQRRRPQLARPERDRSADQPEADDADPVEDGRLALSRIARLDDREIFWHARQLRIWNVAFGIRDHGRDSVTTNSKFHILQFLMLMRPSPGAPRAPGKCFGRWPAR